MTKQNFHGFPPRPNLTGYTATPNVFFDEVLANINNMSELKILLAVFRKTYGWVKEIDQQTGQPIYKLEDEISYTQFEKMTGLSSTSVATGITRAIDDGYLEKVQQGNYSGTTSSYRVVTLDGSGKPAGKPKKEQPKPGKQEAIPVVRLDYGPDDTATPKKVRGTSLSDVLDGLSNGGPVHKTAKDNILDEIFSKPQEPVKEEKVTPHQEFISNWYRCFYSKLNLSYGNITGKEHGHIKALLKEYNVPTVIRAMEFYFNNYKELEGVPNEHPTITIFYSWRKKIVPSSQNGIVKSTAKTKPRNAREFEKDKWADDTFFNN